VTVRRRLQRIEERRTPPKPKVRPRTEAQRRSEWETQQLIAFNEHRPRSVFRARDFIALRRVQGELGRYSAQSMISEIVGKGEDLSRPMVEHTVYRAIFDEEKGLARLHSELPDAWRDAFVAGDEWRTRLLSVPVDVVAAWVRGERALLEEGATEDEMLALIAKHLGAYGIDEPLLERAAGPDRDLLEAQEAHWVLFQPIADILRSDWGWAVSEEVRRLDEVGGKS
jgi:hypothetical protein